LGVPHSPSRPHLISRLPKRQLLTLSLAWFAAVGVVAWLALAGRQVAIESGERATQAFASIVEQQIARTFQAAHLTLAAIADAHQLGAPRNNDPHFRQMMMRRVEGLPFLRAVFVVGHDGWIQHDTDYPATPAVTLSDRDYVRGHLQDAALLSAAWPPVESRSGTGWFIPVTRALRTVSGVDGIVVAALQADHFREELGRIPLADGDLIALFHVDGTLLASHPHSGDIGRNYRHLPLFARHLPAGASGSFWSDEALLPGERAVSYRAVQGAPIVVHVSRSRAAILKEWQRTATGAAIAMLALTLFLGWFIAHLAQQRARRDREREGRVQAEKLEALGQLTGGIAHDFKNMLSVMTLSLEMMRRAAGNPGLLEGAIATTERAVRGASELVERLLSFARQRPLALVALPLDAWLEAARPLLAQAAGPRIELALEPGAGAACVSCDPGQLDSALVNLVANARDAMAGSGRILLRTFPCRDDGGLPRQSEGRATPYLCLSIHDRGIGMSEDVRRRALEPFYTTKGENGTGLGLPQVYGFMKQIGGNITVESEPGQGTTVHLIFPATPCLNENRLGIAN
jgi:two-component system, NtrC family, sensor kinase